MNKEVTLPIMRGRWDSHKRHGLYTIVEPTSDLLRSASIAAPHEGDLFHLEMIKRVHIVDNGIQRRDEMRRAQLLLMHDLGVFGNEDFFNAEDVESLKVRFNGHHQDVISHLILTKSEKEKVDFIKRDAQVKSERIMTENARMIDHISALYNAAEENVRNSNIYSMDDRVRARFSQFEAIQIVSDVDKTITDGDAITKGKGDGYLGALPASVQAEAYMAHQSHGRVTFPETFIAYWNDLLDHPYTKPVFHYVGEHIHIRPGVPEFLNKTMDKGIPVALLSAQFMPVIEGVKANLPAGSITDTYAVEQNNIFSTEKRAIVIKKATEIREGEQAPRGVIYIGDGSSDLPAMEPEAQAVVGVYFALEGGDFARELEQKGLPYYTYNTFTDIQNKLEELNLL